jgi:O-antigen polymerase
MRCRLFEGRLRKRWRCSLPHMLFYLTCFACTADVGLFVYPSLSRSLLMESGILLLAVSAAVHGMMACVTKRSIAFKTDKTDAFYLLLLLWGGYVMVHGLLSPVAEEYRTFYLCTTLSVPVLLAYFRQNGWLNRRTIENGLLMIAGLHLICISAQTMGVADTGNAFFRVTGSNENPTITALYLTGCVPFIVRRISHGAHRSLYACFLFLSVIAVMALRCRTAYIGLVTEAVVGLCLYVRDHGNAIKFIVRNKWALLAATLLLGITVSSRLYTSKRDSADGRLLIWRLSAEMIAAHPQGYGYGLFEKEYNIRQADYFRSDRYTVAEKRNADFIFMPYNDYLEHGIEGGIVGMLFLTSFYLMGIGRAARRRRKTECAVISAFALMSFTNFVYASIQPWFLLLCCSSMTGADCINRTVRCPRKPVAMAITVALAVVTFLSVQVMKQTAAQIRLKELAASESRPDDGLFAAIEKAVGTSEAYWSLRADNHIRSSSYDKALWCLATARRYSSSPNLLLREYLCYTALGRNADAVGRIETIYYMQPHKLSIKQMLMRHCFANGMESRGLYYAREIVDTGVKIENEKAARIIHEAEYYIEKYEKDNND